MPGPAASFLIVAAALLTVQLPLLLLARALRPRLGTGAVVGGLLLPLLLLAPWFAGGRGLAPTDILTKAIPGAPEAPPEEHRLLNDAVYQFLPWEIEVRRALGAGRWPFWSDALEGGSSPWANPQAGAVSPLAMAARLAPPELHLLTALALKILVAFQGAWLLGRALGAGRIGSLVAGGAYGLGGGVLAWAVFPHSAAAAWIPWVAVGAVRLLRRPRRAAVVGAAVATTALLLSGHPETALGGGLLAAWLGLVCRCRRTPWRRGLGAAVLAAVLGFGLAAPHLVPFLHALPDSQRAARAVERQVVERPMKASRPLTWFEGRKGRLVLAAVNPRALGRPYADDPVGRPPWTVATSLYAGLVALGGTFAALGARRSRRRAFLLLLPAAVVLLAAAHFLPLARLLHAFEPLRLVRFDRLLAVTCLGLAVAGGLGWSRLLLRTGFRRSLGLSLGLALAAAVSLGATALGPVVWLWPGIGVAAVLGRFRPRLAACVLGLVLLLDLVPWGRDLVPRGHPDLFYPRTPLVEAASHAAETEPGGPWRTVGLGQRLYPSLLAVYGLEDVRHHNPLAPGDYSRVLAAAFGFHEEGDAYFSALRRPGHPLLDFLGVRFAVGHAVDPAPRRFEDLDGGRFGSWRLYRNPRALPRWFFPWAAEVIEPVEVPSWIAALRDPRRVALLRPEVGGWRPPLQPTSSPVRWRGRAPGLGTLEVPPSNGVGDRLLASSISGPRGWSAAAGGQSVETLTVNGAFLGLRLPEPADSVALCYLPRGLGLGLVLFLTALVVVVILGLPRPRQRSQATSLTG